MKIKGVHIFVGIVCLAVAASIIAGFVLVGSPSQQRAMSLDQQRVNDLQQITYAVDAYYNQAGSQHLPTSLDELRSAQNVYVNSIVDPGTGMEYEYHGDTLNYQLCADFQTEISTAKTSNIPGTYQGSASTFWDHPIGHKCFDLKVNAAVKQPM